MVEINLLPDVKRELIRAQRMRNVVIDVSILVGMACIGLVILLCVYIFGVQTGRSVLDDNAQKSEMSKISQISDLSKILTVQNQLQVLPGLNNQKPITSRILSVLSATTSSDISISSMNVDTGSNTMNIEGYTNAGYNALDAYTKTIKGAQLIYKTNGSDSDNTTALVSAADLGDTTLGEDSSGAQVLRFSLAITYATELVNVDNTDFRLRINNSGNASDSYLGIPNSIFVEQATDAGGE